MKAAYPIKILFLTLIAGLLLYGSAPAQDQSQDRVQAQGEQAQDQVQAQDQQMDVTMDVVSDSGATNINESMTNNIELPDEATMHNAMNRMEYRSRHQGAEDMHMNREQWRQQHQAREDAADMMGESHQAREEAANAFEESRQIREEAGSAHHGGR